MGKGLGFSSMTPMLVCNDVGESARFYSEVLGFEILSFDNSIGNSGFASLKLDSIHLMLCSPSYYDAPQAKNGKPLTDTVFYYYTDDVVHLKQQIDAKGVQCTDFKVRFYGLKEIEIQDPDGRILIIGQETNEPPTPE